MKNSIWVLLLGLACMVPVVASPQQQQPAAPPEEPAWAFPVPDKTPPSSPEDNGPKQVPESTKSYTAAQIDDLSNPPDWFPDEHTPMPQVVAHGAGKDVPACASCHLVSGFGHPESANLTGLPEGYVTRQLVEFKSGVRKGGRMNGIGKALSDDDAKQASDWFASLKPGLWIKVVETDTVPRTWVNKGRMRLPLPDGGSEPIGTRIIEVPQDPALAVDRDPHSGFTAYAPKGSLAKGEALVTKGGAGKTIACAVCHGEKLTGLAEVPALAGHSPTYIARQLYLFQRDERMGTWAPLMKAVVKNLNDGDIVAISAYVASRNPNP